MEAECCLQEELEVDVGNMWEHFRAWVQPNLGKKEKWMPFHTVLGAHELFIVQKIHHNRELDWDAKRRFASKMPAYASQSPSRGRFIAMFVPGSPSRCI